MGACLRFVGLGRGLNPWGCRSHNKKEGAKTSVYTALKCAYYYACSNSLRPVWREPVSVGEGVPSP